MSETYCQFCHGTGYSPTARDLERLWYGYKPCKPTYAAYTPDDPWVQQMVIRQNPSNSMSDHEIELEAKRLCMLWNNAWRYHLNRFDIEVLIKQDIIPGSSRHMDLKTFNQMRIESDLSFIESLEIDKVYIIDAQCQFLGYQTNCIRCEGTGVY